MKIEDLRADLRALHNICRFNGHTRRPVGQIYSVAEHTAHGLDWLVRQESSILLQKAFAVHDLPEAKLGLGDINRNIGKLPAIAAYKTRVEAKYWEDAAQLLEFDPASVHRKEIKALDNLVGVAEVEAVARGFTHDKDAPYDSLRHGWVARRIRHPGPKPIWNLFDHFERLFGGTWR